MATDDDAVKGLPFELQGSARILLSIMRQAPEMADVPDDEKVFTVCSESFRRILYLHSTTYSEDTSSGARSK
jgi:hypothetical protein